MPNEEPRRAPPRLARVLLVDDDADIAELLRMLLSRRGFEVTIAASVAAALAAAAAAPVDVLVSDLCLPDGDGCDVVRQLRHAGALPAIAISGLDRASDVQRVREAGFDELLQKPVDVDELVDALWRVSHA